MDETRGEVPFRVRFLPEHEQARVLVQIERVREQNCLATTIMNTHLAIAVIAAFGTVGPCLSHAAEPQQLSSLRDLYQRELGGVVAGVNAKYLKALTALQTTYTRQNQLDSAIAVKTEIDRIAAANGGAPDQADFKHWLKTIELRSGGDRWEIKGNKLYEHCADGRDMIFDIVEINPEEGYLSFKEANNIWRFYFTHGLKRYIQSRGENSPIGGGVVVKRGSE